MAPPREPDLFDSLLFMEDDFRREGRFEGLRVGALRGQQEGHALVTDTIHPTKKLL